jgi:hypothetical protein
MMEAAGAIFLLGLLALLGVVLLGLNGWSAAALLRRHGRMRSLVGATVALALVELVGARAQAEEDLDVLLAQKRYDDGARRFAAGDFRGALAAFEEGRRVDPLPAWDYDIGRCHEQLGEDALAVDAFERFLAVATGDQQHRAALHLRRVRARLAKSEAAANSILVIESVPPGAEVRIEDNDGSASGLTPFQTRVAAGGHLVYLRKPGYEPLSRTVQLAARERVHLQLVLRPTR